MHKPRVNDEILYINIHIIYYMHKPRVSVEILYIYIYIYMCVCVCVCVCVYKTFIARKLSKPDDSRYRPKHVVFCCY